MRKSLLLTALLSTLLSATASAQTLPAKLKPIVATTAASPKATTTNVALSNVVASIYTAATSSTGSDNYYILLSDQSSTSYDAANAKIDAVNAHVVFLDLYAPANSGTTLPEGQYALEGDDTSTQYYYDATYSATVYYGSDGKQSGNAGTIDGTVSVSRATNGTYTISLSNTAGTTYTFNGSLSFNNNSGSTTVYPQITTDISTTFTGGMAFYHGNLMESNTGNMYINLFDCAFDSETGAMQEKGLNLTICAFNRLFGDPAKATIVPGTYTVARNFNKETYYPGMEIDYSGMTVLMGTYIKRRKAVTGADSDYDYGYITDGTVTITNGEEDGTFDFVIDCTTDRGHKVQGTAKNISFNIIDMSDDEKKSAVSNLDDDVLLDLDYIKTARAYYGGCQNGVNVFIVDIGSPSGKDGSEGDLMRMEFQASTTATTLPAGTYELMEYDHNYTNLYAPYKLTQGYFYNGGELSGTRYWHFAEGRTEVVDTFAAVISGTIGVEILENNDYKFSIDVADGRGFLIQGKWQGPMQLNYDPSTTGITTIADNAYGVHLEGNEQLIVNGINANDNVSIYAADGQLLVSTKGTDSIDISHLGTGIYIVNVANKATTKFVKK